ncbi:hypothetical protein [Microbulbifer taiwanensis]|uniref:hypothetical protein n=1 Tax=Microbulbifer taiwanensis TaxID=986746 RepID=UPI003619295C
MVAQLIGAGLFFRRGVFVDDVVAEVRQAAEVIQQAVGRVAEAILVPVVGAEADKVLATQVVLGLVQQAVGFNIEGILALLKILLLLAVAIAQVQQLLETAGAEGQGGG